MLHPQQVDKPANAKSDDVLVFDECDRQALANIVDVFGLRIECVEDEQTIPGSYWGDEEAGLIGRNVLVRRDTPVHSILHESCHFVCMDTVRRSQLNTNAGGDYEEENAVCYLQILLSRLLPGMGQVRMFRDMDIWGYSFRLGSARAWFESDAEDARQWLTDQGIINESQQVSGQLRQS